MTSVQKSMEKDARKRSILIVGLDCFLGDSARGVLNPVLWPLLQRCGGNVIELGYLVSTFSVGRMLVSTAIGRFADESPHRHRGALLLSGAVLIAGVLLWANVLHMGGLATLFIAQFLMGVGTGNLGVLRSYVAEQALPSERTWQLARLSSLQYAGFAATPVIGAALYVAGVMLSGVWRYALPPLVLLGVAVVVQFLLYYQFENLDDFAAVEREGEREREEETSSPSSLVEMRTIMAHSPTPTQREGEEEEERESSTAFNPLTQSVHIQEDTVSSFSHISMTTDEEEQRRVPLTTHTTPTTHTAMESIKNWLRDTFYTPLLPFISPSTEENDLQVVYALLIFLNFTTRGVVAIYESIGTALLLDVYGFSELQVGVLISCSGIAGAINLLFFKDFWAKRFSNMTLMIGGLALCLYAQIFLTNIGPDQWHAVWEYALSLVLVYSFGYPLGNSAVLGMFSQLQKQGKQGKAQGQFALMGSVARIVMPIVAGYMNQLFDPLSSFSVAAMLMSGSLFGIFFLYHKIRYFVDGNPDGKNDPTGHVFRNQAPITLQWVGMVSSAVFFVFSFVAMFDFFHKNW